MPEWVSDWVQVLQLLLNAGALIGGAIIWKLYVDYLKAASAIKDATIQNVEKSRDYWREKAEGLEKRSPEVVEKSLAERIQIRDAEINRLKEDKEFDKIALRALEIDKAQLEQDMFRTQGFRSMLALEESGWYDEEHPRPEGGEQDESIDPLPSSIEVDLIGLVAVDSGQLLVTDPAYIDPDWRDEPYAIDGPVARDDDTMFNYSYDGACRATLSGGGHGQLAFEKGHAGAGVVFGTAWGDGMYEVYAEKHDGRIVRVYINVA